MRANTRDEVLWRRKTALQLLEDAARCKAEANAQNFELLIKVLRGTLIALENVVKPGHDEDDDYTRLGCAKHHANEALEKAAAMLRGET